MNSRVEKLAATSSKIFGGDKAKNRRKEELKDTIKVTEEPRDCAVKENERIKVLCFVFDSFLCLFASLSLLEKHRGIILVQHSGQMIHFFCKLATYLLSIYRIKYKHAKL